MKETCEEDSGRLDEIQKIVPPRREEEIGRDFCYGQGFSKPVVLSDILLRTKMLPDNVIVYIVGGIAQKGTTQHDIDIFVVNNSRMSKDELDRKLTRIFLNGKGRVLRTYSLSKLEEDLTILKKNLDMHAPSRDQKRKIDEQVCNKINPILEIHSHCKKDETESGYPIDKWCECVTRTPKDDKIVYKCSNKGYITIINY